MPALQALLIAACGAAVLVRAARGERDRAAWALIGAGLLFWAKGDLYYVISGSEAYPSPADALYLAFYGLTLAGIRLLATRTGRGLSLSPALITSVLGLATVWSWLVFNPVLGSMEGSSSAVATTLAYPLLDLLLLCSVLVAFAGSGWSPRGPLLALLAGITITGVADAIYVGVVADGSLAPPVLDWLWPIGAIAIAGAAWMPGPVGSARGALSPALQQGLAGAAMLVALGVLVWDQYESFNGATTTLAALTLVAATAQLLLLYRGQASIEHQRRELEALHGAAAQASLDSIITADGEGRVLEWNQAAERAFGYSRAEALGRGIGKLIVPPSLRSDHKRAFERVASGGEARLLGKRVELTAMRSDGSEFPVEMTVMRVAGEMPIFTAFVRDISVRKQQEEERDRLAAMVRATEDAMLSATLEGIIIAWNPAAEKLYGYSAEEAVGQQLRERLVPADLVDEASEMLRRVAAGKSVAMETKRRHKDGDLVEIALRAFPVRDELGQVTGITTVARDITDRRRREREQRSDRERRAWQVQIEDGLERDNFVFHAQPVIELASGRIAQHELLIRLRMNGEIVPPGRFLAHAESSDLMKRIDRWAIRRGIELARRGPAAINLSAKSLDDGGLVSAVEDALATNEVDPRDVTFEITETAAIENLDAAATLVDALTQIGCGFALDDFGTGYGSFTYLMHLPVTELKIDMEFIRGLSDDPADQRVVRSIVAVAQNFELTTVAEGVEEPQTFEMLRSMEVDRAQGYLIGRPRERWTTEAELSVPVRS